MMPQKRGISIEASDRIGIYTVRKKKGKLTVKEIQDAMNNAGFEGVAIIAIRMIAGGDGWFDEEPEHDAVDVQMIDEYSDCPICRQMIPTYIYCPECGAKLREVEQ